MDAIIVGLCLSLCAFFGLMLQYVPFFPVFTSGQKRILKISYAALIAVNIVISALAVFFGGVMAAFTYLRFGMIGFTGAVLIVNLLVSREKAREHFFVFGVVLSCNYLLLSIPNYVITFFPQGNEVMYLFVVLILYIAILLLSHWPMRMLLCHTVTPFLELDSGNYWNTIWFMPIVIFCTKFLALGGEHNEGSIMQLAGNLLYIFVIILICLSVAGGHKRMREREVMEKQLAGQEIHYAELKVRVEDARRTKHDYKHHIAAIRHFIDTDDKEGLRQYCDDLSERSDVRVTIPYSGNTAADGILYSYMQRAQKKDIRFEYSGTIRSDGIANVDLCVLLGNALDNALTGCLTLTDDRRISVMARSEEQVLSLMIQNTFDGLVSQKNDVILSRKRDQRPGVGLSSMKEVCDRYGGTLTTQWDDRVFTVMLVLPLNPN